MNKKQNLIDYLYDNVRPTMLSIEECADDIIYILETEKYRWHDLRKNPKDLPNDGDYIMCCYYCILTAPTMYEIGEYASFGKVFPNSDNYDFDYWYVRAWREIEPFGEDDDEH